MERSSVDPAAPFADDAALFRRMADGDRAALRALYDLHAARAVALAARILGSLAEAEECVQDCFLEVWRKAAQFDGARGSAVAWVMLVVRSRAIDRVRTRDIDRRTVQSIAHEPAPPAPPSPLETAEERATRERVGAALAELPPEQRRAIEMAYFEGLTQREIAERSGEPLGTVKTRVRLALEKLGRALGGRPPS